MLVYTSVLTRIMLPHMRVQNSLTHQLVVMRIPPSRTTLVSSYHLGLVLL